MHSLSGTVRRVGGARFSRTALATLIAVAVAVAGCDDDTPANPRDANTDRPADRPADGTAPTDGGLDRPGTGGASGGSGGSTVDGGGGTGGSSSDVAPDSGPGPDAPAVDGSGKPDVPADLAGPDVPGCNSTCRADQVGVYCANDKTVATCRAEGACYASSGATACMGAKVCSGAPGAAACACPAAGSAAGAGCGTAGAKACGDNGVVTCALDPGSSGCLVWIKSEDCAAGGTGCSASGGTPTCGGCPSPTTEISVDPVAGNDAAAMAPTGAANPPACRFKTLARAITAATAGKLKVVARGATKPVRFEADAFPINVPAGVRVSTEDPALDPAQFRIVSRTSGEAIVALGDAAAIEGFTLESAAGTANNGVLVAAGTGTIKNLRIETSGAGKVGRGVAIGGDVPAAAAGLLTSVSIARADDGLFVGSTLATSTASDVTIEDAANGVEIGGGALTATNLTVRKATTAGGFGVKLGGEAAAARLVATNLVIKDLARTGIDITRAAGAPAPELQLTGGEISGLGESGIAAESATLTITGTNIHHNTAWGLEVASTDGTTTLGRGTKVESNRFGGISVRGGNLTATGISSSRNLVGDGSLVDGIRVEGGTVVVHDSVLDENEGRAFVINGGSITVDDGSVMRGNGRTAGSSAIRHQAGTLLLGGPTGAVVEVSGSGRHGLYVWTDSGTGAGSVTIQRAKLTGHLANGIFVDVVPGAATATVSLIDTEISGNDANGVRVDRAAPVGGTGVRLQRVNITGNGKGANDGVGIVVNGTDDVALSVESCTIKDNRSSGVIVRQEPGATVETSFTGNDVQGNNLREDADIGGVHFASASTLSAFRGNQVHGNVGPEVGFSAPPNGGGAWTLGSGACDAATNKIYCYGAGAVGIRLLGTSGLSVNATGTTWQSATPLVNVDWSAAAGAGTVTAGGACGPAVTTCP